MGIPLSSLPPSGSKSGLANSGLECCGGGGGGGAEFALLLELRNDEEEENKFCTRARVELGPGPARLGTEYLL